MKSRKASELPVQVISRITWVKDVLTIGGRATLIPRCGEER